MKILILAQQMFPDVIGGSARVAYEQARELAKQGAQIIICAPRRTQTAKQHEIIDGMELYRYGDGRTHIFGQSYVDVTQSRDLLKKIISEHNPDVVLVHQPTIGYVFAKLNTGIPMIYMFHASVPKEVKFQGLTGTGSWKKLFKWAFVKWLEDIEERTILHAKYVCVLSQYSKRLATKTYPEIKKRVIQIPTGIDIEHFKPVRTKKPIRAILGIDESAHVFLTVRRLVPRMGLANLVKAMTEVVKKHPSTKLYIVGEGVLYKKLENQIKKLQLDGNVFLTGRVKEDDLHMFYQASDCFVLSTQAYEGLGIATLEALASGIPVLGTPVGATKEILGKVDPRLILESATSHHIAKGMIWYLEKGINETDIRTKARKVVLEHYTWEKAGKELIKLSASLCKNG